MSTATAAKELATRFHGAEGARPLRELMLRQAVVHGQEVIADLFAGVAEILSYEPGEQLIRQGATDTGTYFILCGSVTVSPNDREDTVRAAGTTVGEMATIDPSARRSATVQAREPTVVAHVTEQDFSKIADAHPKVWRCLALEMANRLRQRVAKVSPRAKTPRIFIASSSEGKKTADELASHLSSNSIDVKIWTDGIFTPGLTNIEALEAELDRADFAAILLSPDDKVESRGTVSEAPRDNLILELGLFAGAIGRHRALMVYPRESSLKLPTDLLGVIPIRYPKDDIKAAAAELLAIIGKLGGK